MDNSAHERTLKEMRQTVPAMRYQGAEPFLQWQKKARERLISLLGMPKEKCKQEFRIEYREKRDGFEEIRFTFQSEEGYRVPCHLWIPKAKDKPLPVMICLQGHSTGMHISMGRPKYPKDEELIKGGDRDFAVRAVGEGFCALSMEQRYMGECGGTEDGPQCYEPAMADLLMGRTVLGERIWDVCRAIDVLKQHFPETDPGQVMCMGNSGGGTTAFYAACVDERIQAVMPSCALCTFEDSIASMHHCACNFVPGIRREFDMGDLGGLIAPRKCVVVNGREDPIFPLKGAQESFARMQSLYKTCGADDACRHVIGNGGHRFYADDAWPVLKELLDPIGNQLFS